MMARPEAFTTPLSVSGLANLVSPGSSVFLYSPLLVLAPLLAARGFRREPALVVAALANFFVFWWFFSRFLYWTGLWSAPGPRYLTSTVPLLLLPLGLWLQGSGLGARLCFVVVSAFGWLVQGALLTTSWAEMVERLGYLRMGEPDLPPYAYVFEPAASPVLAAFRFASRGELNDMWIVDLARGWRGFEGAPAAAWGLGAAWALGIAFCTLRLWGCLQAGPEETAASTNTPRACPPARTRS